MSNKRAKISATISGSFNKHLDKIQMKILEFQQNDIKVLSPKLSQPISSEEGFIRLEINKGSPRKIEIEHLEAISNSDFLYVMNPEGYIGKSVALEIGYAISKNVPVYSLNKPEDVAISFFIRPEKSIKEIKRELKAKTLAKKPLTLAELQDYVRKMVRMRGFEEETIEDVLLLLTEEIGELARAIRGFLGLKTTRRRQKISEHLMEELADCLIYLLDIANLANINLDTALREKEKRNSKRKWH